MTHSNFMTAYLDNETVAMKIAKAQWKALDLLEQEGLVVNTTRLWADMCSTAWTFHVEKKQG